MTVAHGDERRHNDATGRSLGFSWTRVHRVFFVISIKTCNNIIEVYFTQSAVHTERSIMEDRPFTLYDSRLLCVVLLCL
jgi:hypothetical protein